MRNEQLFVSKTKLPALCLAFLLALTQAVTAQDAQNTPKIKTLPPAYNDQMLRLAEILGALHYLRNLCGADEKDLWRTQMEAVIENEEPTEQRKAELISRFNRGVRTYREIYRECTPSAIEAVNLYLRQGMRIAGEIPERYGQ